MRRADPDRLFLLAAAVGGPLLLFLGAGMTFFADDWAYIESRSLGDPATWFSPHNEHWSTLPILVYRTLVETVGLGSYLPYLAVLIGLHLLVATLVYALVRRSSGRLPALASGVVVLLFGSGFENLYWAFQIGFVGSVALGLAAMLVSDGQPGARRAILVALLLLASLASSGIGIAMSVAVGIEWLLEPRWRHWVPTMAIPAGTYAAWYVTIGRVGITAQRDPFTLGALPDVPAFVVRGFGNAVGSVTGLPWEIGFVVGLIAVAYGVRRMSRGDLAPRAVGILGAVAVQYALTGLVRAQLFEGIVSYTRYTYVSGIICLVGIWALIGPVRLPAARLPRLAGLAALAGWLTAALVFNVMLLLGGRALFLDAADTTRALIRVALDPNPPPGAQLDQPLVFVPSPVSLKQIVSRYGDPSTDALVPWAVRPIPPDILAEARRILIEGARVPGSQ